MTTGVGDHDRQGNGYLWRALSPGQVRAIAARRAAGVSARNLAVEYGVSVRTIYRAVRQGSGRLVSVRVEDWHAEFMIGEGGPVRCTPWLAVGS